MNTRSILFVVFLALINGEAVSKAKLPVCDQREPVENWSACEGRRVFSDKSYSGQWLNGLPHGIGVFVSRESGDIYSGEVRRGRYDGRGAIHAPDGRVARQVGLFKEGRFLRKEDPSVWPTELKDFVNKGGAHESLPMCPLNESVSSWWGCIGEFQSSHGQYRGVWSGGRYHGLGSYITRSGDEYHGYFRDGEFHGLGMYLSAKGRPKQIGVWHKNTLRNPHEKDSVEQVLLEMFLTAAAKDIKLRFVSQSARQAEQTRGSLALSASASQADPNGVVTLTITTNSDTASLRVNGDEEGGHADGRYSVRRFARVGENKFEVVATDRFGNTQRQTVSVVREPADTTVRFATLNPGALRAKPATNAVAIIIGIQDYRRVPKADFANNDARVFYDYAIRGLGVRPENVKLLVDQQADDVEILGAFKNWLPLKAKRGQTDVYVFYSGHGLPSDDGASLYFLPHGVDRQFLDRTAIKQAEIVSALQAVSPKSVTLFLDACYSGQSRGGETLLASARPISIQPKASTFPSNFTVLSASAPEQIASSSPDLKHGIFSYFLMKGMEGEADQNKDGSITVQEMQAYLSDSVGRKAMSLNRTQQPQLIGEQSRVLVGR